MKFQRSLSSITTHNGKLNSQPKMRETKKKSLSKQIDFFFYCTSTIKNLSQKTPWPSQNPRENTGVINRE